MVAGDTTAPSYDQSNSHPLPPAIADDARAYGVTRQYPSSCPWWKPPKSPTSVVHENISDALTFELLAYSTYMRTSYEQHRIREELMSRVERIARTVARAAGHRADALNCIIHGSSASELNLPFADLDLNLRLPGVRTKDFLRSMSDALKRRDWCDAIEKRLDARVPVLRFKDSPTGITVDLCMNEELNRDAEWASKSSKMDPRVLPLTLVLRHLLHRHDVHDCSQGGLGGFALVALIITFLRLYPRLWSEPAPLSPTIGELLLDFLKYYSDFDYINYRISPGSFPLSNDQGNITQVRMRRKTPRNTHGHDDTTRLMIEHPLRKENVSRATKFWDRIVQVFKHARLTLMAEYADHRGSKSLLASIVKISASDRSVMQKIQGLYLHMLAPTDVLCHSDNFIATRLPAIPSPQAANVAAADRKKNKSKSGERHRDRRAQSSMIERTTWPAKWAGRYIEADSLV
ncbi:hypothetical protein SeLEV6574_g00468 [Synchytrium endobioticum]|uniref:polynucleotide adenylyltransferase n=1 Tax=Synchytrium endobioticum TaxID=286115 RepID=A0A507DJS4_9FUNG|nr:hypothetical protein SeLEV6574_g00468 [Synchytrium endobioticum]